MTSIIKNLIIVIFFLVVVQSAPLGQIIQETDIDPLYDQIADPRPPHVRPEPPFLNHDCKASLELPRYTPWVPAGSLSGTLNFPQSDTTNGFVDLWVAGFKKWFPHVEFNVPIEGSGIAGPCLAAETCDGGIIAREMLLTEKKLFRSAFNYDVFELPVGGGSFNALAFTDAMTFFVHPSNPLEEITYSELDAIWSKERFRGYPQAIKKWGQLKALENVPEYKDKNIALVGVSPQNGFEYFLNLTVTLGGHWVDGIESFSTVFKIATTVSLNPLSMGYSGIAYLNATVKPLRLIADQGWPYLAGTPCCGVEFTRETVCHRTYPLSRLIYIYIHKIPCEPIQPIIAEFLNYVLSYEGQKAIEEDKIFDPLPVSVILQLRRKLYEATLGCGQ